MIDPRTLRFLIFHSRFGVPHQLTPVWPEDRDSRGRVAAEVSIKETRPWTVRA